jgi:hypothetical protein
MLYLAVGLLCAGGIFSILLTYVVLELGGAADTASAAQ